MNLKGKRRLADRAAQRWGAHKVVGVDIDDSLIRAAWRRRIAVWSAQGPTGTHDYFPASFDHSLGPLPIPPIQLTGKNTFPNNISFRTADWVNVDIPEDQDQYDVIVAWVLPIITDSTPNIMPSFSISKWIHLNQGDEGVKAFFRRIYAALRPGGTFVLEPQAWDTYKKAKRMDKVCPRLNLSQKTLIPATVTEG